MESEHLQFAQNWRLFTIHPISYNSFKLHLCSKCMHAYFTLPFRSQLCTGQTFCALYGGLEDNNFQNITRAYVIVSFIIILYSALQTYFFGHLSISACFFSFRLYYHTKVNISKKWGLSVPQIHAWAPQLSHFKINWVFGLHKLPKFMRGILFFIE